MTGFSLISARAEGEQTKKPFQNKNRSNEADMIIDVIDKEQTKVHKKIDPQHTEGENSLNTEGDLINKQNNANLKKKAKNAERRKTKKQDKKTEVRTDRETNNEAGKPFLH